MAEAFVTSFLALIAAIAGHLLERRYGHRMDEIERRLDALERTDDHEDTDT